ncbi:hypothetical protein ACFL7D_03025 [candidate division KSB1 bacterium]
MPASQKIGSFRPLTFLGNGKPMRPGAVSGLNREPSRKGVQMSGGVTFGEFKRNISTRANPTYKQLGSAAVKLQKAGGISINTVA